MHYKINTPNYFISMKTKLILLFISLFISFQVFSQTDYATLHIYRSKAFCIGCRVTVLLDDKKICELPNGGHLEYQIFNPKRILITITDGSSYNKSTTLDVKKGKTYYFNASARLPRALGFNLKELDKPLSLSKLDKNSFLKLSDTGYTADENFNKKPDTDWNKEKIIAYWNKKGIESIEGIYEKVGTSLKYNLALIEDGNEYKLIYLSGANGTSWNEGDIKATLQKTATFGLFKATWKMLDKSDDKDIILTFDKSTFSAISEDGSGNDTYIKIYPTYDDSSTMETSQKIDWSSSGTGFLIERRGLIATNYHVIDNANSIKIDYENNTYSAKVLVTDRQNDLAILKIDDVRFTPLNNLEYNFKIETIDVGTSVFALGYPMANIMGNEIKFTDGKISAKSGYKGDVTTYQISVPIQHGNSGGALFDESGNLVGITSSGIDKTVADNVNYAIKTKYLNLLVDELGEKIKLPNTQLNSKTLSEKIKILSKYVVFIKVKYFFIVKSNLKR